MTKRNEYVILLIILVTGACLRFYHLGSTSLTNDELSALTRARYDTFSELVEKGIRTDGHPALVQTAIWLVIRHIGDDEWTLRFPFALAGVVSIFLLWLTGRRWFGPAAGLMAAAGLAALEFPVLYSQLARPYSIGLMFVLAAAFFWTRILFDRKKDIFHSSAFVLAMSACLYTHYFAFLVAGIIGLSGLFFAKRSGMVHYVGCNLLVLLLYLPHLSIFQAQFAFGGIGGWLPEPDRTFLPLYVFYGFNNSYWLLALFTVGLLAFMFSFFRKNKWNEFHTLCLAWYILPFLVGFCYSVWKAPVLQFSTLLFSFPFLLLFIFSFVGKQVDGQRLAGPLVLFLLFSFVFSTVAEKKYYSTLHFGEFRKLAEKTKDWDEKYGTGRVLKFFSLNNPEYLGYYFRKLGHEPHVSFYPDDERLQYGNLSQLLDTTRATHFVYGWTNISHFYETTRLIMQTFPVVVERDSFFNSEIILFARGTSQSPGHLISETGFEKDTWKNESETHDSLVALSGKFGQRLDSVTDFSTTFGAGKELLKQFSDRHLKADVSFNAMDSLRDASVVIAFMKNGEMQRYTNMKLGYFYSVPGKWTRAFVYADVPEESDEIRVYVWNPSFEIFHIDDFRITAEQKLPF